MLGGARVPLIVINSFGDQAAPRRRATSRPANHYSLLATIEQLWNLGCLGNTCGLRHRDLLTDLFRD